MTMAGLFGERAQRDHDRTLALAKVDPQIGALIPDEKIIAAIQNPDLNYREIISIVLNGYSGRPAFGVRDYEIRTDGTGRSARHYLPRYRTISYGELAHRVTAIASAWQNHMRHRVVPGDFVALIGFSGAEMNALDLACVYAGAISVPLQANLPAADLTQMLTDVAPVAMAVSVDNLEIGVRHALDHDTIRSVVVFDCDLADDAEREAVDAARAAIEGGSGGRIAFVTLDDLIREGEAHDYAPPPRSPEGSDALSMICFTSGSTGTPKGALTHEAICSQFWTGLPAFRPTVCMAYAPINHFMGRIQIHFGLGQGGTVYFSLKSDLSTLLEDIRLARPTQMIFMPRFAELIYQHYLSEVQRRVLAGGDQAEAEREVRDEMGRSYLGDRLIFGGIGSSPTAPEVRRFIDECFGIQLVNAYSSTELGTATFAADGMVNWNLVIDYKLQDVPELGYYTTDKPWSRGELLAKTRRQIKGYYKRPDATAAILDPDGYIRTGDIVEQRDRDHIEWLDRRNNVIKLSQAEFVAIGPLEARYLANNPLFAQMYLYGNSHRAFLLAVVVPDVGHAGRLLGHAPTDEDLRTLVLQQFQTIARDAELKSFEVPRDVLIDREPFTYENGLLTSARKPSRPNLRKRYADRLEAMYLEMDRQQREELLQLRAAGGERSTIDRVAGGVKANLGLAEVDPHGMQSYRDLGGDSLGAAALAALFDEMFGIGVPVSFILSPAVSLGRIADFIDRAQAGDAGAAGFAAIHGDHAETVHAGDLTLDRFFDEATLAAAAAAAPPRDDVQTVLLTGATGFLGRFLCLDWMEWLAARDGKGGGKVICIVRARDAAEARARLDAAIDTRDLELAGRFRALARDHLEVIAGDLAAPRLGLGEEDYARLAREVDQVMHCGALVNHVLSYRNLFEPNVLGTVELIRLALTGRQKRFEFVSTIGVPMLDPAMAAAEEGADPRVLIPSVAAGASYARGYALSKWACEVLLRQAHHAFGLPVVVYRPDMILGHARYRGQINVPDMFTRLLYSVALTGLAPRSFYALDEEGRRQPAHYDGLPVDFVSAALQQIGRLPFRGFAAYTVVNVNRDDGISLDTIVDWMETAGYAISRIEDHAEWHRRIGEKLRQLPEEQRQHSSLDILHSFAVPIPAQTQPLRADQFAAAVGRIAVGPTVPHVTEPFIHKYLDDMTSHDLIAAPRALLTA